MKLSWIDDIPVAVRWGFSLNLFRVFVAVDFDEEGVAMLETSLVVLEWFLWTCRGDVGLLADDSGVNATLPVGFGSLFTCRIVFLGKSRCSWKVSVASRSISYGAYCLSPSRYSEAMSRDSSLKSTAQVPSAATPQQSFSYSVPIQSPGDDTITGS